MEVENLSINAGNRFCDLSLEESAEVKLENAMETKLQTKRHDTKGQGSYESETNREVELGFAVSCLFRDIREVREYLQEIWDQYAKDKIELTAAAMLTSTAIEFVSLAEHDLLVKFSNQLASDEVGSFFILAIATGLHTSCKSLKAGEMKRAPAENDFHALTRTAWILCKLRNVDMKTSSIHFGVPAIRHFIILLEEQKCEEDDYLISSYLVNADIFYCHWHINKAMEKESTEVSLNYFFDDELTKDF